MTISRLQELLEYDPATGLFRWRGHLYRQTRRWFRGGTCRGYRFLEIDGRRYRAHIVAWVLMTGAWPERDLDHRNQDRGDNRWSNLRLATRSQNGMNRRIGKNNTTGVRGVTRFNGRGGQFRAVLVANGKMYSLGLFDDVESAARARRAAEQQYYGEFAPQHE